MTPAQRKYDRDFIGALRRMAQNIEPRSRQLSDTLKLAAERIDALSSAAPIDQPASTPEQPQSLYGEGHGRDNRRTGPE
jgi:hypothetical protein